MKKARKSKTGTKKPRASDAKIELRVSCILQLKLDGAETWNIRQYIAEKEQAGEEPWKMDPDRKPLSERMIRYYIAEADERLAEACRQHEKNALKLHISQRRGLYARALEEGDFGTALAVLRDLAQLADLYPAPKKQSVEVTQTAQLVLIEEIVERVDAPAAASELPPGEPTAGAADGGH